MEQAIQLYGFFILSLLGVIAPILVILFSMFHEGMQKLTTQYESERIKSEKNIQEQLKKIGEAEKTDITEVKSSLKKLEVIKKNAKTKLVYLDPKKQIRKLSIPLVCSFIGVILAILKQNYAGLFVVVSLMFLTYALFVLWKLLGIIIEVRKITGDDKRETDSRIIELLTALVEKEAQYFLKKVYIAIDDKNIKDDTGEITIAADKKQELKIGVHNSESRMAKNMEIGFIFPLEFIIEKTDHYSIYTNTTNQIVRYTTTAIHGNTNLKLNPLIVTPLKEGAYKMRTFIKAENIESVYRDVNLKVTPRPIKEILKDILTEQQKGEQ